MEDKVDLSNPLGQAFAFLDGETKAALKKHHAQGGNIQQFYVGDWTDTRPEWFSASVYRVKPEPKKEEHAVMVFHSSEGQHAVYVITEDGVPVSTRLEKIK